ncbi:MAG TPA: DUF1565 domain-containing protein [Planctomycetota bacterium]|jgi:hypothetical protein|nr:DUF1565 domain-containing protein [Planctomycetota bacterium]
MRIASCLALLLAAPAASAADYYVNAATGNDATGLGSLASPWKTITHALAQVPGPGDAIHVAAGIHNLALGEVFPLTMKPGVHLIGAGLALTLVDALGVAVPAVRFETVPFSTPTRLEGIRISNTGGAAVRVATPDGSGILVSRCSLLGNSIGLRVEAGTAAVGATLRQNFIGFNFTNVFLVGGTPGTTTAASFDRNWITLSSTQGVTAFAAAGGAVSAKFLGDRIESCLDVGLFAAASSGSVVLSTSSLTVFHQASKGIDISTTGGGSCSVSIDHATIADNTGAGVSASGSAAVTVSNSIVRGNASGDFAGVPVSSVLNCVVGPGPYAGQNGNLAVDPLFVNPAADDYQIQQGSPCIDTALAGPATRDAYGDSRPLDGNLDGLVAPDIGSDEYAHAHVAITGTVSVGGTFNFLLTGSPGVFVQHSFSFSEGALPIPYWGTAFVGFPVFTLGGIAGFPPTTIPVTLPNDPSLAGLVIYIQSVGSTLVGGNLRGSLGNVLRFEVY